MKYPQHLLKLIDVLRRLPGVGNKSAERFAFQMLQWNQNHLEEMAAIIKEINTKLKHCENCGSLQGEEECRFCTDTRKSYKSICIIASPRDVFAIDETGEFKGLYHVLGGLLSPLEGLGPEKLNLQQLKQRIQEYQIKEVVIALDSTLEGDATSLYIKQELNSLGLNISRLAFGLPMGSSLDYVDGGTLARAFMGRNRF
jgi:recombination protein RecR